jgi:hypothetical protein
MVFFVCLLIVNPVEDNALKEQINSAVKFDLDNLFRRKLLRVQQ